MRSVSTSLLAVLLSTLTGCGSDDADANGGNTTASLSCAAKQLKAAGNINGQALSVERGVTNYRFENKLTTAPGRVSATTANGSLLIEFNRLTADGQSSPARGNFTDDTLSIGNCETGDFVSTLTADADGNGVHFTLKQLVEAPYCSGDATTGAELSGCVGFER